MTDWIASASLHWERKNPPLIAQIILEDSQGGDYLNDLAHRVDSSGNCTLLINNYELPAVLEEVLGERQVSPHTPIRALSGEHTFKLTLGFNPMPGRNKNYFGVQTNVSKLENRLQSLRDFTEKNYEKEGPEFTNSIIDYITNPSSKPLTIQMLLEGKVANKKDARMKVAHELRELERGVSEVYAGLISFVSMLSFGAAAHAEGQYIQIGNSRTQIQTGISTKELLALHSFSAKPVEDLFTVKTTQAILGEYYKLLYIPTYTPRS